MKNNYFTALSDRALYLKAGFTNSDRRQIMLERSGLFVWKIFRTILLICMAFVILYPIMYMISMSIRDSKDLYDPTIIWVTRHFTLDNFNVAIENMEFWRALIDTVKISVIGTVLNIAICLLAGYGFSRFDFKFKGLLFAGVIITIIVPAQNVSIPMYMQFLDFDFLGIGSLLGLIAGKPLTVNLLNTELTLYIPALFGQGIRAGLFIYIFRQFFRGMPRELEDAAYVDGCGVFATFLKIMVPNAKSSIVTCLLFSFVWYWNDYYTVSMYFDEAKTVSVALAMLRDALQNTGYDTFTNPYSIVVQMQAGCLITILPLLLIFVFAQRFFTESIERTGLVG